MSGRTEATTMIGHRLGIVALCVAWAVLLARGLDGAAVLFLIASWVVLRRGTNQTGRTLAGILLCTAVSMGMVDWIWGWAVAAAMVLAGALLPPARPRSLLHDGVLISAAIIVLMIAFAGLRGARPALLAPGAVIAAGWWMILRWQDPGVRLLTRTTIPVWGTALAWLVLVASGQAGAAAERHAWRLVRCAVDSPTGEAKRATLSMATRAYPWSPSLWAERGAIEQSLGAEEDAFGSFKRGYEIRPGRRNPCLAGLCETARLLGRWHCVADLIARRLVEADTGGPPGRLPVAVELWRRGAPREALEVLGPREGSAPYEWEVAGWIHHDMGQDSAAVTILERAVAEGSPSGETVSRLVSAYRRLGRDREADLCLSEWGARFPHHIGLARQRGSEPGEPFARRIGDHGLLLGNAVRLVGWDAEPSPAPPGDTLVIRTCWVATKPLTDLRMILHLDRGSPTPYRLNLDHAPLKGAHPTSRWPIGETVIDTVRVRITEDAPVGQYRIFTGLWVPGDEESRLWPDRPDADLLPRGEKRIPLGTITVGRR